MYQRRGGSLPVAAFEEDEGVWRARRFVGDEESPRCGVFDVAQEVVDGVRVVQLDGEVADAREP